MMIGDIDGKWSRDSRRLKKHVEEIVGRVETVISPLSYCLQIECLWFALWVNLRIGDLFNH